MTTDKVNKALQQIENNTNSVRWTKITFKYQTLTSVIFGISFWALKYGRKSRGWEEKRVAGDKDGKGSVWVCPLEHPQACLLCSLCCPKPISSAPRAYMVLAGASTDRQLLLNPDCFRFTGCERVWLRGCDPSEGGLPPPSLSLEGGRRVLGKRGRRRSVCVCVVGGYCRHHVTHVSCWADQNGMWTKTHHLLLPASGYVCVTWPVADSANTEIKHVVHIINAGERVHIKILHISYCSHRHAYPNDTTVIAQIASALHFAKMHIRLNIQSTLNSSNFLCFYWP